MNARLRRPRMYDLDVHVALDAQIAPENIERLFGCRIHGKLGTRERMGDGPDEYVFAP